MFPRIRYRTSSFLWAMLLFAVCAGWLADRSQLQHTINVMIKLDESDLIILRKAQRDLQICIQVNEEMRNERKTILRANAQAKQL